MISYSEKEGEELNDNLTREEAKKTYNRYREEKPIKRDSEQPKKEKRGVSIDKEKLTSLLDRLS